MSALQAQKFTRRKHRCGASYGSFFDPVYRVRFTIVWDTDSDRTRLVLSDTIKVYDPDTTKDGMGNALWFKDQEEMVITLSSWDPRCVHSHSVLSHECFHASTMVLMHYGAKLSDDSDEAFAYHFDFVHRMCLTVLSNGEKIKL